MGRNNACSEEDGGEEVWKEDNAVLCGDKEMRKPLNEKLKVPSRQEVAETVF